MNLPKGEGAVSRISLKRAGKLALKIFLPQLREEQPVGRGIRGLPN